MNTQIHNSVKSFSFFENRVIFLDNFNSLENEDTSEKLPSVEAAENDYNNAVEEGWVVDKSPDDLVINSEFTPLINQIKESVETDTNLSKEELAEKLGDVWKFTTSPQITPAKRLDLAEQLLGRGFSEAEAKALLTAHHTESQFSKIKILFTAQFDKKSINTLMRSHLVGTWNDLVDKASGKNIIPSLDALKKNTLELTEVENILKNPTITNFIKNKILEKINFSDLQESPDSDKSLKIQEQCVSIFSSKNTDDKTKYNLLNILKDSSYVPREEDVITILKTKHAEDFKDLLYSTNFKIDNWNFNKAIEKGYDMSILLDLLYHLKEYTLKEAVKSLYLLTKNYDMDDRRTTTINYWVNFINKNSEISKDPKPRIDLNLYSDSSFLKFVTSKSNPPALRRAVLLATSGLVEASGISDLQADDYDFAIINRMDWD